MLRSEGGLVIRQFVVKPLVLSLACKIGIHPPSLMADSFNRARRAPEQHTVRKSAVHEAPVSGHNSSDYQSVGLDTASSAATASIKPGPPKIPILGMDFDNYSMSELLASLHKGVLFTPNVDHLMKLRSNPELAAVYGKADIKVCDSQIIMYASRFLGSPIREKLSGSDLFPLFCDYHKFNEKVRIFLLGGRQGVARCAQLRINSRIGREIVVGEYSPPLGFEQDPQECQRIISAIEQSSANVVAVCLGAPKQEQWIADNCDRLPSVDIFMAVGAVVDFEAGTQKRAPRYLSQIGLEWLYRLIREPRRLWRRYLLEGMPFFGLILAEKLKRSKGQ